jgi:hypothetical protein
MQAANKASRASTTPRLTLLMSSLTLLLLLLSLIAVTAACATTQTQPTKAPAPTTTPQSPNGVKACPAYTRYNPKTGTCDKIRF